jgi:hypothetical protein
MLDIITHDEAAGQRGKRIGIALRAFLLVSVHSYGTSMELATLAEG